MDMYQAMDQNLVVAVGLPVLIGLGLLWSSGIYLGSWLDELAKSPSFKWPIAVGSIFVLFWIARLMPWGVGYWLKSGLSSV